MWHIQKDENKKKTFIRGWKAHLTKIVLTWQVYEWWGCLFTMKQCHYCQQSQEKCFAILSDCIAGHLSPAFADFMYFGGTIIFMNNDIIVQMALQDRRHKHAKCKQKEIKRCLDQTRYVSKATCCHDLYCSVIKWKMERLFRVVWILFMLSEIDWS